VSLVFERLFSRGLLRFGRMQFRFSVRESPVHFADSCLSKWFRFFGVSLRNPDYLVRLVL